MAHPVKRGFRPDKATRFNMLREQAELVGTSTAFMASTLDYKKLPVPIKKINARNNSLAESRAMSNLRERPAASKKMNLLHRAVQSSMQKASSSDILAFSNAPPAIETGQNTPQKVQVKAQTHSANRRPEEITHKQIEIYAQVFEEIISQDNIYGGLLINVKKNYDDYIEQLHRTIEELREQVTTEPKRTVDQTVTELTKLRKDSESKTNKINQLQEENNNLIERCETGKNTIQKFSSELRSAKAREEKLIKLLTLLKDRGYPVEEINCTHVKKRNNTEKPTLAFIGKFANANTRNLPNIPKLLIPTEPMPSFHQDFIAKQDEFSESWRNQMILQNR